MQDIKILAYRRTTAYPKPGSFILIEPSAISEHVNALEANRDIYIKQHSKIISKFAQVQTGNTAKSELFYKNEIEKFYSIDAQIAIKVDSIETVKSGKSTTFYAKCYLSMLHRPVDIEDVDKYLLIDANDAQVVEPVLCHQNWQYSEVDTDNVNQFSIPVQVNGQQYYRAYNKSDDSTEMLNTFVETFGMKEWSKVTALPSAKQNVSAITEQHTVEHNSVTEHTVERVNADMQNDIFLSHPLARFTNRLYEDTLHVLAKHNISITPEVRADLEEEFKNTTIVSDVSISFYDEEDFEDCQE